MQNLTHCLTIIPFQRPVQPVKILAAFPDEDTEHLPLVVLPGQNQGKIRLPCRPPILSDNSGNGFQQLIHPEGFTDASGKSLGKVLLFRVHIGSHGYDRNCSGPFHIG